MKRVTLADETDFDGWRKAARSAVLADIAPEHIAWRVGKGSGNPFATDEIEDMPPVVDRPAFNVSKAFVELAKEIIAHSDPERFALLYRLLRRLRETRHLLADANDPDVRTARAMAEAIRRDIHTMHASVRFKEIEAPDGEAAFVAWFEPDHYIMEAAAPFFVRRFAGMRWSIFTPHRSASWDRETLSLGPGVVKAEVPDEVRLEEHWRTSYASIFNSARLKNPPEAAMIEAEPTAPSRLASAMVRKRDPEETMDPDLLENAEPKTLAEAREAATRCKRCDLYGPATQVVFGEGPETAEIIFVGEQPGDKEDLAGHPFVGPAGAVLDRALKDAGIERDKVYVTNAVKHFKYEPRGKFRLHKKPDSKEIAACRYWLDLEKSFLEPKIIVALGASAGQALLGRAVRIGAERGTPIPQGNEAPVFITVHPSYLLRLPDEEAKRKEYARFVEDLAAVKAATGP